jgi:uncharacterized protein YaiI (UPF0178 family)
VDSLWRRLEYPSPSKLITIDADAGPVKQEIYRVAERDALKGTALKVFVVSGSPSRCRAIR